MSTQTPARRPAGSPAGGQFAPNGHAESDLDLADAPDLEAAGAHMNGMSEAEVPMGCWTPFSAALDAVDQVGRDTGTRWDVTSAQIDDRNGLVVAAYCRELNSTFHVWPRGDFPETQRQPIGLRFVCDDETTDGDPLEEAVRDAYQHRRRQLDLYAAIDRLPLRGDVWVDRQRPNGMELAVGSDNPDDNARRVAFDITYAGDLEVTATYQDPFNGAERQETFFADLYGDEDGNVRIGAATGLGAGPTTSESHRRAVERVHAWVDDITGVDGTLHRLATEAGCRESADGD